MDEMAKNIRMSHCKEPSTDCPPANNSENEIWVGSNYGGGRRRYEFSNKQLKSGSSVILDNVEGKFIGNPDDNDIRLVTIRMWIAGEDESTAIQTSVSQRSSYSPAE